MRFDQLLRWTHLVAVATWTGGLLTLAALVPALRSAGAERPILQAAARRFAAVSWTAMGAAVATGIWQVLVLRIDWGRLLPKLTLVGTMIGLALFHQITAKRTSPAVRGVIQGIILVLAVTTFGVAVGTFT